MKKQTLILIDIQRGFEDPYWGRRNNPSFESNVAKLLREWRTRGWPVVHIRHNSATAGSPLRLGQSGNSFMECAIPLGKEHVVEKAVNSAFIGTKLQALLTDAGITNLVFAGLTSDHCVSTSVRMAANLGFVVTVIADATATFARRGYDGDAIEADVVHRVALASLDTEFAHVTTTAGIISSYAGDL